MAESITTAGLVATTPRHLVTAEGLPITSFRLATTSRKFDARTGEWVDGEANWYTVTAFHDLAINAASSIEKGHRILVQGSLRVRDWDNGERSGTSIEIEAEAMGHDLSWGTAVFTRTVLTRRAEKPEMVEV
jgi:single-strand DNA-binding protein